MLMIPNKCLYIIISVETLIKSNSCFNKFLFVLFCRMSFAMRNNYNWTFSLYFSKKRKYNKTVYKKILSVISLYYKSFISHHILSAMDLSYTILCYFSCQFIWKLLTRKDKVCWCMCMCEYIANSVFSSEIPLALCIPLYSTIVLFSLYIVFSII